MVLDKQGVDRHGWRAALFETAYCPIHSATCIHQVWTLCTAMDEDYSSCGGSDT